MRIKSLLFALIVSLSTFTATRGEAQERYTPRANTPEEIIAYVERAARYVLDKGEEVAFKDLTDPQGPWVNGDWYLYINSFDGHVMAHLNKKLEGKTLIHIRDIKGNAFYAELQAIAQSRIGKGWVEYWWPKPDSKVASRKLSYVTSIPGKRLWIGSGTYDLTDEMVNRILDGQRKLFEEKGR